MLNSVSGATVGALVRLTSIISTYESKLAPLIFNSSDDGQHPIGYIQSTAIRSVHQTSGYDPQTKNMARDPKSVSQTSESQA